MNCYFDMTDDQQAKLGKSIASDDGYADLAKLLPRLKGDIGRTYLYTRTATY